MPEIGVRRLEPREMFEGSLAVIPTRNRLPTVLLCGKLNSPSGVIQAYSKGKILA